MSTNRPTKPRQLTRRRVRNAGLTVVGVLVVAVTVSLMNQSLRHSSFFTGYALMTILLLLTAFGMRKRLSFLSNIGSAKFWMQLHIYVGLASFAVFGLHIAWRMPTGIFEIILAVLFLIVGGSGFYGLVISRTYPSKLTSLGGEVIFERIPLLRAQIASRARMLVLQAGESSDVLARFYVNRLSGFLERPRGWSYLAMPNGRLKRQLVADIADLDRYLADDQRDVGRQLSEMVEQRDKLDYHHALQGRLKIWLFVHIGMTYSLLIMSIVHMILAHSFAGGWG